MHMCDSEITLAIEACQHVGMSSAAPRIAPEGVKRGSAGRLSPVPIGANAAAAMLPVSRWRKEPQHQRRAWNIQHRQHHLRHSSSTKHEHWESRGMGGATGIKPYHFPSRGQG